MRLPKLDYIEPKTLQEACSVLSELGQQARILAGGTDLVVMVKQRVITPGYIVNIKKIPGLTSIIEENNCLRIGALTTLHNVATSPIVQDKFSVLSRAAASVATRQIRSMATIGGNLCLDTKCWYYNQSPQWKRSREACLKMGGHLCYVVKGGKRCYAVVSGDTVPVLAALNAEVIVVSPEGEQKIPVESFLTGTGETPNVLRPGDIVTEIQIPFLPDSSGAAFIKHSIRAAIDFATLNTAAVIVKENGTCKDARIVIGAVGPAVVRVREVEEVLRATNINEKVLEEAGEAAVKAVRFVSPAYHSVSYRRKLIKALTKRVVRQAMGIN